MENDERFMRRALELAERGRYTAGPNPMVGCVIVRRGVDGDEILAEGWHQRAGHAHAEAHALAQCANARGATMFVTLEPCAHHGRTPPCANAIVEAGLARVVIAMRDPHDVVNGRGIEILRDAGIDVVTGVLEPEARRMNEKFAWAIAQKLPFVLIKAAMTLDGKLATVTRDSQWITGEAARERSLALREEYDAILVGSGTVQQDNPRLTRRLGLAGAGRPWTRAVLDGDGDVPPHAQLFTDGAPTILFTAKPERITPREDLEIIPLEGRADLELVFGELHARGIHSLMVEGGAVVHSEIIRRGLWQKMQLFIAPMIVGGAPKLAGGAEAPAIFTGEAVSRLTDAYAFRFDRAELVGRDLMLTAYPA